MALVARKKAGQNLQSLINEFRKLTFEDPGLEKARLSKMTGFQKPSKLKNIRMTELRKASAKIRRRNRRMAGFSKK